MRSHPALIAHEREVTALRELSAEELKTRYLALTGQPLPKYMRRGLMAQAVAHAEREAKGEGFAAATRKRLDALAATIVPLGAVQPRAPRRKVRAGTRLLRAWQGQVHEVEVTSEGFVWQGQPYGSLSQIARVITGTRWNGWAFFGLKDRPGGKREAVHA